MAEHRGDSYKPIYLRIREDLMRLFQEDPEGRLPPERELCRRYNVCRPTVQKALSYFVENNMMVRRAGKGSFFRRPSIPEKLPTEVRLVIRRDWRGWAGDCYFGLVVQGVYAALDGTGIGLSIGQFSDKLFLELLETPDVPSLWLSPEENELAAMRELADAGGWVTAVNRRSGYHGIHFVSVDHYRAGEMVAEFIHERHGRRVLFLAVAGEEGLWKERERGLLEKLDPAMEYRRVEIRFPERLEQLQQVRMEAVADDGREPPLLVINSGSLYECTRQVFPELADRMLAFVDNAEPLAAGVTRLCQPIVEIGRLAGLIAGRRQFNRSGTLIPPVRLD